ncbi:GAF and ANTAR domain-containing protein [Nocardioides panacisoli]|uniref:GAF and ANTAR domain-containing protein n=1 Tax=Nocardioides panacisoli TaxID=627624 RepID=A0ABP7INH2_9ACTN
MDQQDIIDVARRLAEALNPGDLDSTLGQITAAAVEVLPDVHYASITIRDADDRLETAAPTDPMLLKLDEAQYLFREGPCYEAAADKVHVTSPDLASDPRFPRYAPVAVEAGILAQAGIRLFEVNGTSGALNLYSEQVGSFGDLAVLGQLFAHQAGVALDYAREIENVREALNNRGVIGQAVGIVMERFRLDDARAFGFLVRLSQEANTKVRVLAEELVARAREDYDSADAG